MISAIKSSDSALMTVSSSLVARADDVVNVRKNARVDEV